MDGSQGGSGTAAPFLVKTYEMIDDNYTNSVVSWSDTGKSFVVWDPPEFAKDLLPKYFKHNNFNSFIRQLNTYGFRKIDPEQWEFANEEFMRGKKYLLKNIYRRKPIHSHSITKNVTVPLTDLEREEFMKEIERLKRDNLLLQTDLEKHKEENQAYEQRILEIDQRQKQLVTLMAQQLNKREFTSTIMQVSETHNKKRKLVDSRFETIEKLDYSVSFWENFLQETNQTPTTVEDVYEFGVLPQQSSRDSEPQISSPETSSICIDVIHKPKSSIDVNSSPSINQVVPAGANDVFWQQFFTETPRALDAQEVLSERKETWWNMDSLAKQMGHLSPAGKNLIN